jgi:hypothetical protein
MTSGPIPKGSNILVEYDPASQWYNAAITIAAGWLRTGGEVSYSAWTQSPNSIRACLNGLGIRSTEFEATDALRIWDYYTLTLGLKSNEKHVPPSLKAAENSISFTKDEFHMRDPNRIRVVDDLSGWARFNDDKSWVELMLTRSLPATQIMEGVLIQGLMKGVHD